MDTLVNLLVRVSSETVMEKRVFITKCEQYEQAEAAVIRVLEAFGGAKAILDGRKRVVVKPNLLLPRKPDDFVTTHPAVVQAVCVAFVQAGAEVSLIDSTGGPHTKIVLKMLYGRCGMAEAATKSGAKLCYDTATRTVELPEGKIIKKQELLSPVLDADMVITVAKAKTHSFQAMTGCVKNMFGCVPGLGKPNMHRRFPKREDFASMLVDICQRVKPGFCILDGIWGMEGAGPSGGDPKHLGVIAGGISPYAVDVAQCYLMGLRFDSIYTIQEATARGFAPSDSQSLTWLGDDAAALRKSFKPAVQRMEDAVPVMTDDCVSCGDCVRICPMQCITINNGSAEVDGNKCIRCYCCHEFCPAKAVRL